MNRQISSYERRLSETGTTLRDMEDAGETGRPYQRLLRQWLELLAAYEYEVDVQKEGASLAALAAGV